MPAGNRSSQGSAIKTLAFRIPPALHAQFSAIVQLLDSSLNVEGPIAIAAYVEKMRSNPEVQAKAEAARQAFEQEMAARQGAIDALFGTSDSKEGASSRARSVRKGSSAEASAER